MLVTSSSDSSVLDTENGDVYIRRTERDYPIPPFEWQVLALNMSLSIKDIANFYFCFTATSASPA